MDERTKEARFCENYQRIPPKTLCEFADKCRDNCTGKDAERETSLSCGLRRFVLFFFDGKWPEDKVVTRTMFAGTVALKSVLCRVP